MRYQSYFRAESEDCRKKPAREIDESPPAIFQTNNFPGRDKSARFSVLTWQGGKTRRLLI